MEDIKIRLQYVNDQIFWHSCSSNYHSGNGELIDLLIEESEKLERELKIYHNSH